jgi:integral membrane protein
MPAKTSSLRLIGRLEGVSFLILVGLAMPLKYLAGLPVFVKWTGWAHGVLFVAYAGAVILAWHRHRWPLIRPALLIIASLLPFGPFVIEKHLVRWEKGQ